MITMLSVRTETNPEQQKQQQQQQTCCASRVTTQPKRVVSLFLGVLVCGLGTRFWSQIVMMNEQQRIVSQYVLAGNNNNNNNNKDVVVVSSEQRNFSIPETVVVTGTRSPAQHPRNETRMGAVHIHRDDVSSVHRDDSLRETVPAEDRSSVSPREDGVSPSGHDGESVPDTTATTTATKKRRRRRGLPSLDALTSFPENTTCPEGYVLLENTVLPENITHAAGRRIPRVVHVTARSRCVTTGVRDGILKWKLPDHSLYFHDDGAVFDLLDYITNDRYGNELVRGLSESMMCISSGATLSDFWRYAVLYHYGGIYTDIDNAPGENYTAGLIRPDTDAFFFVEATGTMTQYYMASSRHHPVLLHFLSKAGKLRGTPNVMVNNPARNTGPSAVKRGMIGFQAAVNVSSDGYLPEGVYRGGAGSPLLSELPWWSNPDHGGGGEEPAVGDSDSDSDNGDDAGDGGDGGGEYPSASDWRNRTVTVFGNKKDIKRYVQRASLQKGHEYRRMNMTHYHDDFKKFPRNNRISCEQHVSRMITLVATNTSFYHNKHKLPDLLPRYEFRKETGHYFDRNTQEKLIPWKPK